MSKKTNWKELIEDCAEGDPIIYNPLSERELLEEFDCGYGGSEGRPFTAWSEAYVYFPVVYDGAEWVGCAPRFPGPEPTKHVGGE